MKDKKQISINIAVGVLFFAVIMVLVLVAVKWKGKDEASADKTTEAVTPDAGDIEKWQEGDVSYGGKKYRYNTAIKTYLFLGIDKSGTVADGEKDLTGGQSDAIFLLVTNREEETLSVISVNRNTMAMVDVYDLLDNFVEQKEMQICLQHAYGDGGRSSCLRTVDAVSRLFYNIPISGYLALNMDGIPILNDGVGGVTVEVMDDLENQALGVSLKKGETVTLNGTEAYVYIRARDINEFDSAGRRLERQNQYLIQLFQKIQSSALANKASVLQMHDKIKDYLVTSIDFVKLTEDVSDYGFDESHMYSLPGETVMGEVYEEYRVDEDAFYEMILDIFYKEVEE